MMEKNRKNNAVVMIALIVAVVAVVFAGAVLLKKTPSDTKAKAESSVQTVIGDTSASSVPSSPESRESESSREAVAETTQESVEAQPDASDTLNAESTASNENENRQSASSTESAAEPDNFEILDIPAELYSLIANPEQLSVGLYEFCFNNINKNITKAYVYNEYSVDNGTLVFTVEADGREVVVKINESGSASFAV